MAPLLLTNILVQPIQGNMTNVIIIIAVSTYTEDMKEYLNPEEILATVSDIAGFTGCELLRRYEQDIRKCTSI